MVADKQRRGGVAVVFVWFAPFISSVKSINHMLEDGSTLAITQSCPTEQRSGPEAAAGHAPAPSMVPVCPAPTTAPVPPSSPARLSRRPGMPCKSDAYVFVPEGSIKAGALTSGEGPMNQPLTRQQAVSGMGVERITRSTRDFVFGAQLRELALQPSLSASRLAS
jgi:hypothetical protein